ncbi:MAG: bacillithiol system redox-active protein YtxJ [Bacteroidetes bacterium]|jgi:bacillithiol system protein YtxJ|nr:bacillithiol system redox-active protein YtxJ [Bacteroidota bacterium]
MNWNNLTAENQLEEIKSKSVDVPQLIFKHSTRCATSSMAKSRLERAVAPGNIEFYYLDLLKYRNISNKIENDFMVHHESPQVLLIRNGECIYDESHNGISMDEIIQQLS